MERLDCLKFWFQAAQNFIAEGRDSYFVLIKFINIRVMAMIAILSEYFGSEP